MSALDEARKPCTKCGEEKNLAAFAKNRRTRDGVSSWCRNCLNTSVKAAQSRRREHMGDDAYLAHIRTLQAARRKRLGTEYERRFSRARTAALSRLAHLHRREYEHLLDLAKREFDVESARVSP